MFSLMMPLQLLNAVRHNVDGAASEFVRQAIAEKLERDFGVIENATLKHGGVRVGSGRPAEAERDE